MKRDGQHGLGWNGAGISTWRTAVPVAAIWQAASWPDTVCAPSCGMASVPTVGACSYRNAAAQYAILEGTPCGAACCLQWVLDDMPVFLAWTTTILCIHALNVLLTNS